jgi:hypothetical protein
MTTSRDQAATGEATIALDPTAIFVPRSVLTAPPPVSRSGLARLLSGCEHRRLRRARPERGAPPGKSNPDVEDR